MSNTPEPDHTPAGPAYEGRLLTRPDDEVVDQGVGFDVATLVSRRSVLSLLGLGVGAVTLAACSSAASSSSSASTPTASSTTGTSATAAAATSEIPEETNGPYPADGTNGVDVLTESGIVRSDVTSSLEGGTTVDGVPLTFTFSLTDMSNDNAAFEGAAVYMWQCDAEGQYSMYSEGVEDETYLRGVQVTAADGTATFQTIVPGCYSGRWPHIHFEVYPDVASATDVSNAIATSQVALPQDMLDQVFALDTYPQSAQNLAQVGSLENDGIFGDGYSLQLGTFSGEASSSYIGSLAVAIDPTTTPTMSSPGGGGGQGGPGGGTPPAGGPGGAPPAN